MLGANIQSLEWLLQMTAILEALNEGVGRVGQRNP
jgi:hypothetical protein